MEALAPTVILLVTALVIVVGGVGRKAGAMSASAGLAWLGVLAGAAAGLRIWGHRLRALRWLDSDAFSLYLSLTILIVLLLAIPVAKESLTRQRRDGPTFYALMLLSTAGMLLLVSSRHLAVIFVGIEAMSVGVYALAGWARDRSASVEASLKSFLNGVAASAFFLFGIAFFYAVAGSGDLAGIEGAMIERAAGGEGVGLLPRVALVLVLGGLVYIVAAVPFHMWSPDAYEGAPTVVTAFMAVAVKVAALGALLRITGTLFSMTGDWKAVLSVLAVLGMTVGNLLAIVQDDFKRILAYSGVAHTGYLLVGVVAGGVTGQSAVLFYLLGYSFMTLGAFVVAVALGKRGEDNVSVRGWGGLGWKYPLQGVCLSLFLLSLTGIPMTVGFIGKFYVLSAAISEGYMALVLVALVNTVVGAYYYLRIIMILYMGAPVPDPELGKLGWRVRIPLLVASLATVVLGVLPASAMNLARRAALELF